MEIRLATIKDCKQVISLLDELMLEACRLNKQTPISHTENGVREKFYQEEIQRKDIKIFVAEENKKVVGMAELFIVPILRRGYYQGVIETFVVTENLRGEGIGSKLIQAVFKYCKEKKITVLKLTSDINMKDAHNFYKKHGGKYTEKLFRFKL